MSEDRVPHDPKFEAKIEMAPEEVESAADDIPTFAARFLPERMAVVSKDMTICLTGAPAGTTGPKKPSRHHARPFAIPETSAKEDATVAVCR